jgi:hypothetical protein
MAALARRAIGGPTGKLISTWSQVDPNDIIWSELGCLTIRSRPNSKSNGLTMLKHLFPLYEYRGEATSGQSVLGWVTALSDIPLQGKMLIAAVGYRWCITSWGIDQNSRGHRTKCTLISQPWSHDLWLGRDTKKKKKKKKKLLLKVNYSPLRVKKSRSHDMGQCLFVVVCFHAWPLFPAVHTLPAEFGPEPTGPIKPRVTPPGGVRINSSRCDTAPG